MNFSVGCFANLNNTEFWNGIRCIFLKFQVIVLDEAAIAAASIIPDSDLFSGSTSKFFKVLFIAVLNLRPHWRPIIYLAAICEKRFVGNVWVRFWNLESGLHYLLK